MYLVLGALVLVGGSHQTFASHGPIEIHGSGTTNPSKFYWQTMDLFEERSKVPLFMTYRAVGSSTGQAEFVGDANSNYTRYNHFGSGDIPMKSSNYQTLQTNNRTMLHFPFVMGGIAIFHSVPDSATGGELDLNACLLAKIFAGTITTWDHADILAVNPNLNVPTGTPINMVHRKLGSSSTSGVTQYMADTCPSEWSLGSGSTVSWTTGAEAQGSDGITEYIQNNEYAIGYIDAGHGHEQGLSEIKLQNLNGVYLTSAEADISAAGTYAVANNLIPSDPTSDFSSVSLLNLPGASTWPITMISYIYLEQDMSGMDSEEAGLLYAFLEYILSDEGQSGLEEFAFTRIPQEVVTYDTIILNTTATWPSDMTQFTFESAATTQKWTGAGEYVISGKRRTYANYERANFDTSITQLQTDVASLTTSVNSASASSCSCSGEADDAKAIAGVAIAIAIISLILAIASIFWGTRAGNKRRGMDNCVPSVTKPSAVGNHDI